MNKLTCRLIATLGTLAALSGMGYAQTAPVVPRTVATVPKPRTSTTRTVEAIVATIDISARTVTFALPASGMNPAQSVVAVQDMACQPIKRGTVVPVTAFVAGERVVARLTWRTSPLPVVILRDLYDEASYRERQKAGKETCVGVVESLGATEIVVRRTDETVIAFRVTEKTRLVRNDAPATVTAFGIGTPVAVKPRRLPSGSLMASIVGGTAREVAWAYRDTLTTWSGFVADLQPGDANGAIVTLKRDDGATRQFFLALGATFKQSRTVLPWSQMRGATVTAHLIKNVTGATTRTADQVKVSTRRAPKLVIDPTEEP